MQGGTRVGSSRRGRQERTSKGSRSIRGVERASSPLLLPSSLARRPSRNRFRLSESPAKAFKATFPAPPALRGDVHVFHRELLSLLHGLCFAREDEREVSRVGVEGGKRVERVIFEVRPFSFFFFSFSFSTEEGAKNSALSPSKRLCSLSLLNSPFLFSTRLFLFSLQLYAHRQKTLGRSAA